MILWLGVACGVPDVAAQADDTAPGSALDEQAYWFCHEAGADALEAEAWCELLEEAPADKCPGMRATCGGESQATPTQSCNGRTANAVPGSVDGGEVAPPARAPRRPPSCGQLLAPSALSSILTWVGAILVALLVLALLRAVITTFGAPKRPARETPPPLPPDGDEALPDVPNLPSGDLLTAARAALAQGRAGEAVLLARGAALRRLGEQERLRLHRSRTDREYVRALRKDPSAQQELRAVVGAVEHHRWGGDPLGVEQARRAVSAVERLLGLAVVVWLVLGALVGAPAHAQSTSRFGPNGDAALRTVFEAYGYDIQVRLRSLHDLDDEVDALVLDLAFVPLEDDHWDSVARWVREGGVLLVAGDPRYVESFDAPVFPGLGDRVRVEHTDHAALTGPLERSGLPVPRLPGGANHVFTGGEPWVSTPEGAVVAVASVEEGVVVGISDPRLLWNAAFVSPDNEAFIGELLYYGQATHGWPLPTPARVQLATTSSVMGPGGGGADNPLASLQNAGLFPFMVQLLVTWGLFGLWRGCPFAPLRDPPSEGRLEFGEHVQALGTRWFRLGASRYALVQTASLWLARLGSSGLQLAARRAGKTPAQAAAWVATLQALVDEPKGPDDPSDLERMEELWKVTHPPT